MLSRIRAEYLEMPGLRLTFTQAQRLWGLDAGACAELLETLVAQGFLSHGRGSTFVRRADGAVWFPERRTTKAIRATAARAERPAPANRQD
jgi:hypothetical protein